MTSKANRYTERFLDELRTIEDEYEVMSKLSNAPGLLFGMDKLINREKLEYILQNRVNNAVNGGEDDQQYADDDYYMMTDQYANDQKNEIGSEYRNQQNYNNKDTTKNHNVSFENPIGGKSKSNNDRRIDYSRRPRTKEEFDRLRIRKEKKQKRMLKEKYTMLAYLDRMREKGFQVKTYDINSGYSEIKCETMRMRQERRIHFGRHVFVSGLLDVIRIVEYLSNKIEIINLHLDGWSQNVQYNLEEFDDVIEEIVEKWVATGDDDDENSAWSPEAKLGILLLLSAVEHSTAQAGMSGGLGHIRNLFGNSVDNNMNKKKNDDIDLDILKDIENDIEKEKAKRR
jgi:hypothetical protein